MRTDEGRRLWGGAFRHGGGILRRTRGRGMRWSTGDKGRDGGQRLEVAVIDGSVVG